MERGFSIATEGLSLPLLLHLTPPALTPLLHQENVECLKYFTKIHHFLYHLPRLVVAAETKKLNLESFAARFLSGIGDVLED